MWCLAFRPKSSILLLSDQRMFLMVWDSSSCLFGKLQAACRVPFTEECLPSGHSTIKARLVECCRDFVLLEGSPISTELWRSVRMTIGFLFTSLTKALLPRLVSLAGRPVLGRVLVVPNFFHLIRMMDATVFLGTFNAAEMFWYPSPDMCLDTVLSQSCKDNSFYLMAWLLLWHALSSVGPYIDRCAFPNNVQSIEFTTGGLQSSWRNISRMINWNRMHLSSILSLIANTDVILM